MVLGPAAGLADLDTVELESPPGNHRADAVRAHLLELSGDKEGARLWYARAARRTLNLPEQRYLEGRARACT